MLAITYGLMYSYSVFLLPLEAYFKWNRETLSAIYSVSFLVRGAVSIGVGWLADKYGPTKIMVCLRLYPGAGPGALRPCCSPRPVLAYLRRPRGHRPRRALSGSAPRLVSRWFAKNRGLALGIVSTGSGLGTLFIVPGIQALINARGWSPTFEICGFAGGAAMMALSFFLIPKPPVVEIPSTKASPESDTTLWQAVKDKRMLLFMGAVFLFFGSTQIVILHLVRYAEDLHIDPIFAATLYERHRRGEHRREAFNGGGGG